MKTKQTSSSMFNLGSWMVNVRHAPLPIFHLPSPISVLFLPLLLLLLTLPAMAQAQDYTYTTNDGTITITKYAGPGRAVTIPDTINGLPVTSIGLGAFGFCTNLTSVTIPDSVTSIGGVAFLCCTSLTNVTIPDSVTSIGDRAFDSCDSLSAITVDALNSFYSSVAGVLFNKSQTTLLRCPGGKTGDYTVPNSVTSIERGAFSICSSLTSVTIPKSVTSIEIEAFSGCTSLIAITVDPLNSFYSSVAGVLFNKSQTTLIQYPVGIAGSYTIPNSVTTIGNEAFQHCTSLTNVAIPNSVTTIGGFAFWSCTSLTSVTIGNGVTSIGGEAFLSCTSLTSITIPNSVTSIGDHAFDCCTSLTNITIGNSVTNIGDRTFHSCTNLTSVYFKGNAPSPGSGVFDPANNATVYYLPGTTGWGTTFGGRPTALWFLPNPLILTTGPSFGVKSNRFGFIISWATNVPVVVEASTDLANPIWTPVGTNTLTNGSSYFSDSQWTNYPARFYRLILPATGKKWLTVAAVTMTSQTNTEANLQTFFSYMELAASNRVDMIVFPEVALQGCPGWREYSSPPSVEEMAYTQQTAETIPGQSTSNVVAKAQELNLFVVFGMTEKDQAGLLYNANVFLGPEGVIGKHRKTFHVGNDGLIWSLSSGFEVFDGPPCKIGLMICAEMALYPGPALASQGAELLVTSSAWWNSVAFNWDRFTVGNAVQSERWHVVSQQVGTVGHVQVYGHSRVIDPKGTIVCDTGAMEGLVIWTTDILIDARTP